MPTIKTSKTIDAPPSVAWEILTDFGSYPDWNPFIVEASGELRRGEKLKLKMRPPGGRAMTFGPTVLEADPQRELRWLGRLLMPGIFDGEHWFRLRPEGAGTRLEQGENFTGFLPRFMGRTLSRTEEGFNQLNAALKERAEATDRTTAG